MITIKYGRVFVYLLIALYLFINRLPNNSIGKYKEDYNVQISSLKQKYNNDDIVGILKIDDANLEIPIVQTSDNDYYLNHTLAKEFKKEGTPFLDYRINIDSSNKLIIYGHNSSLLDLPFKALEKYYRKDYYEKHKYVKLITNKEERKYEIFSVYIETSDFSYMDIEFVNEEDFKSHLDKLKEKSIYDTNINLDLKEEVLILQTCSNHNDYSKYNKKYLLIISRRIS